MRKLVLDDATLSRLATNPTVRAEFPFLRAASAPARGGCCGGAAAAGGSHWAQARQGVAGLPPARLATLKRLAGAETLLVYVLVDGRAQLLAL